MHGHQTEATECNTCTEGQYQTSTGQSLCIKCVVGKFLVDQGVSPVNHDQVEDCSACPSNTYNDKLGQRFCKPCPTGTSTSSQEAKSENECIQKEFMCNKPGQYVGPNNNECFDCEIGTYGSDNKHCYLCRPGLYNDEEGQVACKTCNDASKTAPCSLLPGTTSNTPSRGLFASYNLIASTSQVNVVAPLEIETSIHQDEVTSGDAWTDAWRLCSADTAARGATKADSQQQ